MRHVEGGRLAPARIAAPPRQKTSIPIAHPGFWRGQDLSRCRLSVFAHHKDTLMHIIGIIVALIIAFGGLTPVLALLLIFSNSDY